MKRLPPLAAVLLLIICIGVLATVFWPRDPLGAIGSEASPSREAPTDSDLIVLTPAKSAAAGIRSAVVERRQLQAVRRVTGRLKYDESTHVAVRSPVEGVLVEVAVKPGDLVTPGQVLAKLSSRDIGEARAEVLRRRAELDLSQLAFQRDDEIYANLQELLPHIDSRASLEKIDELFEAKPLGTHRNVLLSAYSQLLLTEELYDQGQQLSGGAMAGVVQRQRRSDWEIAKASLHSAVEVARFECRQKRDTAGLAVDDARRRLEVSQQRLEILSGRKYDQTVETQELSEFEIVAPAQGAVEQRFFTKSELITATDTLFILADPTTLWVDADLRENEWNALALQPGVELTVYPAGMPDRRCKARLLYVGREMSADSHSVPLVAELPNVDGALRPGMYATVAVPVGEVRTAIAVPTSAVMQHEGDSFVFVAEKPHTFRRVMIETGLETEDWIEVREGLKEGTPVVERGAFALKSELLLEREAE